MTDLPTLDRSHADVPPAAPVRMVHLGLGNFFRAHQVAHTQHAPDRDGWGIAAFAGRSPDLARELARQDGLYTLVVRAPDGDEPEVMHQLVAVHTADDDAWHRYLVDPEVAIVTITVTEAGYRRGADGGLDRDDPATAADLSALRDDPASPRATTAIGRLVAGLAARRTENAGPITVLPCDNLPGNGAIVRGLVTGLATAVDEGLAGWITGTVDFATSMVDRITPATTDADRAAVARLTSLADRAPVSTEPFSEWVISGEFPAGRPHWEASGAIVTDDIEPYEHRKLWLLNGAHSLVAWAGPTRGHETVADAITDPVVRGWVEDWWDVAGQDLAFPPSELATYRTALVERFANPRIRHLLDQIATDGSEKVGVRILPTLRRQRDAGRLPDGAVRPLAAWLVHLRGDPDRVTDARAEAVLELARGDLDDAAARIVAVCDDELAGDEELAAAVTRIAGELAGR